MSSSCKEDPKSKEDAEEGEWEEVITMIELPNGANLNVSKDLCLQVAGMWTDKPVVKLDNMLYAGRISETIGSHLFVECKEGDDSEQTMHKKKDGDREIYTSQTSMTLEPIYIEDKNKTDVPHPQNITKEDHEKT